MCGITKRIDYPDTRTCFHAGVERLPHQNSGILDTGSMVNSFHHRPYRRRHHHRISYLETQTR